MEDGQIVRLYCNREERAIQETARKYAAYCHGIAYRILENHPDAEEVVNDTYLRVWNSIPPAKPQSLSAYLGKISRRLALNRWRSGQAKKRGAGEAALALEELADCIPWGYSVQAEPVCPETASDPAADVRPALLAPVSHPGDCRGV